jgi:hypothetical protein
LPLSCSSAVKDFVIVPLHTTPETSVKEIDELADVYRDVKRRWKVEVRTSVFVTFPSSRAESSPFSRWERGRGTCRPPPLHSLILGLSPVSSILPAKRTWATFTWVLGIRAVHRLQWMPVFAEWRVGVRTVLTQTSVFILPIIPRVVSLISPILQLR